MGALHGQPYEGNPVFSSEPCLFETSPTSENFLGPGTSLRFEVLVNDCHSTLIGANAAFAAAHRSAAAWYLNSFDASYLIFRLSLAPAAAARSTLSARL